MRVISGKLRGRVLKGYNIEGTRPTMDRVKESLFASIYDYIDEAIVLDLFAGSGNLGIEAISNGASKCYFVDNNIECINVIKDNIRIFKIENNSELIKADYKVAIKRLVSDNISFDIIFIDPPYKYCIKEELFKMLIENNLVSYGGIVVYEYSNKEEVEISDNFKLLKSKRYGDKYIDIYKKI